MDAVAESALSCCRASIGAALASCGAPERIGSVTLRPAQQEAASRVRHMLARYRGCLLADDVGRGKTFVALAVVFLVATERHR